MSAFYINGFRAAFSHGMFAMVRQRRTQVIAIMVLMPAFIPLLELLQGGDTENYASMTYAFMTEVLYVGLVTPLLALFFAAMLIGEDVESQTIPYILTRPIPRSAWLAGRFVAYLIVSSVILFTSLLISFAACLVTSTGSADFTLANFGSVFHYQVAATMALLGYGAFCALLGAIVRRPVIVGLGFIFGWQTIAQFAPGATDFLTVKKYVIALLPGGGSNEVAVMLDFALDELIGEIAVSPLSAALILIAFAVVCLALTTIALLHREYTTASAVTE